MSRRLNRSWILLVCLFASEVWALGLGDIRLNSALNEPLRAEIDLLSATPDELANLKINLASAETFERYGIDRPLYLTRIVFRVQGNVIRVTSTEPMTEPFVTVLVEAVWSSGRLLREYTVLLDPPTFAPPPTRSSTESVAAPRQTTQSDRGQIERPSSARPAPSSSRPAAQQGSPDFTTTSGDDYQVQRGDTLWRIAERVRPDNRLSMNQTMLAIYQANPDAFAGNINLLRANARLRVPSADEIFSITRGNALNEIRRQNQAWGSNSPAAQPATTLTLVPPDNDQPAYQSGARSNDSGALVSNSAAQQRVRDLENQIAEQESLLEIRDNELAQLRSELTRMREARAAGGTEGAADDPSQTVDDRTVDDAGNEIFVDDSSTDDAAADDAAQASDEPPVADTTAPAPRVVSTPRQEPSLVDTIIGALTGIWGLIGAALLIVLGVLIWFARRASGGSDDSDSTGVWDALDADEVDKESLASTERLRAMARDDESTIVVVEQAGGDTISGEAGIGDTIETPGMGPGDLSAPANIGQPEAAAPVSLEDTFSSETAINLDQSDPVAEADFHMAYGLYDQAADLINGALAIEPNRTDLMAKLSEIYFVWGNRDGFVDAATRLNNALGDGDRGDWDKIVIMGQQIAGDHELFSKASAAGATHAVDLDFESSGDDAALDIDFATAGPDGAFSDVMDLGDADDADSDLGGDDALDFSFDDEVDTGASITQAMPGKVDDDATVESPTIQNEALDDTTNARTLEQRNDSLDSTSELPSMADMDELDARLSGLEDGQSGDATAEIDLDDLGLDLDGLANDFADDDDDDSSTAETGRNEKLEDSFGSTTGVDVSVENNLLDATGQTQVLPDDFAIETSTNIAAQLDDDDATMLAPGLTTADDPDFDFAKTEALPADSFGDDSLDATAESPGLAGSTDMDLDLDDLTAALKLSEAGDTIEQFRDDATVEQPRISGNDDDDLDFDLGLGTDDPTQQLSPDDVSDDLQEARTMTEVGTKLDLARAYVDMGDPGGARNILDEVLEEGDESQRQQAQQLLDSLPG